MLLKGKIAACTGLALLSVAIQATAADQMIVAPHCLVQQLNGHYQTVTDNANYSLIKVDEAGLNQLIAAKTHQKVLCGGFVNVTDEEKASTHATSAKSLLSKHTTAVKTTPSTYAINHEKQVNQLLTQINPQNIWAYLTKLTSFTDRYANSNTGVQASDWLKAQVMQMAKDNNRTDVSVYTVSTGSSYKQPSVVTKIGNGNEPGIVIGAHMDTLGAFFDTKPGADDDGSGTVTVMEIARTLIASNITFNKPIYIIWYSAEEEGLIGSQHVVAEFKKKNIAVSNVIHFDMTGYRHQNDPTLWLIDDNTNKNLSDYLSTLITTYVKQPVKHTACGYGCSDHATWNENGYNAAIAFESKFGNDNPNIHTANDKMDALSLDHMTNFAKLGVAFAVELASE